MRHVLWLCLATLPIASPVEVAAAELITTKNIRYATRGGHPYRRTLLDVYTTKDAKARPVMLFIHGGGWRFGDKRGVQEKPRAFIDRGYIFVSMNYRFHPDVSFKEQAADVAAAIHWVKDHASEYGGDPRKLYLMGHSAGAHLAALVATDAQYLAAEKLKLSTISGVVLLDGAGYDVARQIKEAPLKRSRDLYRTVFSENAETHAAASPIEHVKRGTGIPRFLLIHVAHRPDSKAQAESMAAKLKAAGVAAKAHSASGKTHGSLNRELGTKDDAATEVVFKFLADAPKR